MSEADIHGDLMKGHILIIDDDKAIVGLIKDILTASGYSVSSARNGREGLNKLMDGSYDLIISDINMPIINGIDLFRIHLARDMDLARKVIFITGHINHESKDFIEGNGARYLLKPFKLAELLSMVNQLTATTHQ